MFKKEKVKDLHYSVTGLIPALACSGPVIVLALATVLVCNTYNRQLKQFDREMSKYSAKYDSVSNKYDVAMAAANAEYFAVVDFINESDLDEETSSRGVTDAYNKLRKKEATIKTEYSKQVDEILAAKDSILDVMYKKHPIILGRRSSKLR